jgi:succinylglutamate desuccinylase
VEAAALRGEEVTRVLGEFGRTGTGPTLLVVSGLHGNEPAGVLASRRLCDALAGDSSRPGRILFLAGNVSALRSGERYLDRDLNRAWTEDRIAALRNGGGEGSAEDREQTELLSLLDRAVHDSAGPVYLLDLHTTSGPGAAFSTVADTLRNRALALSLPVPMVLGLEELVEGTLHDYMGRQGVTTLAFESGQHQEAEAVDRAVAGIWTVMHFVGLTLPHERARVEDALQVLARGHEALPRAVEMRYRHPIAPGDEFRMHAGFRNFQRIRKGEALALDRDGVVVAPEAARLLMPLYQPQGSDGFFVVREFKPLWLRVSSAARGARLDRVVHWLPGIRRHPTQPHALVVNRRVARWYALQVLHLLGFRREVEVGDTLVVERRPHDR